MARINIFSRYLLVAALVAAAALPALAASGSDTGGSDDVEYEGVLAPSRNDTQPDKKPVPAYAGVTTGPVIPDATPDVTPAPSTQYTPGPASPAVIHDLGMASAIYGTGAKISPPAVDFSAAHHTRINGKPA